MAAIERAEIDPRENAPDWSRTEHGTIVGEIAGLTKWNGKPALDIVERLSERKFTCVLSEELSEALGSQHKWSEVWDGRRVFVTGALHYNNSDSELKRADASELEYAPWTDVSVADLRTMDILGDKTMQDHLEAVRGEAFG